MKFHSSSEIFDSGKLLQAEHRVLFPFILDKDELQRGHQETVLETSLFQYFIGLLWSGSFYHCVVQN